MASKRGITKPKEQRAKKKTVLVMKNGARYDVLKMDGKYVYVAGTQFKHSNQNIARYESIEESDADEVMGDG